MRRARILVVEDERITAHDIRATLEGLGHEVPAVSDSGEDALEQVEALQPDLVLLDIRLAGRLDGVAVAEAIHRRYRIPVIYLTANADPETVERATRTEAYGYLLKPFSEQELHTTIQLALYKAEAERALSERESWFRKLVEKSSDMTVVLDPEGAVRFLSPPIERILGYASEELLGYDAMELIDPNDRPRMEDSFRWALDHAEECITIECRVRHRNGSWRVLEAQGTNYLTDPVIRGVVVNCRDITDRKEAEERIRAAKEEAERASRAKSQLLSRTSHELRTPLNAVLGFAQLLESDPTVSDQESVEQILSAGRHLLALVDEVLDLASIEAGRINLFLGPVSVPEVLGRSLDLVRHFAVQRRVSVDPGAVLRSPYLVWADPQRLRQVLVNFLSNAVKYNREGGSVTISCDETPEGRIRIGVRDTGSGIPPEQLERLFVPFERLGAEHRGIPGTGLGLALSKGLAESMNGQVGVESVPGEGSMFWIELPKAEPITGEGTGTAEGTEGSPQTGERIPAVLYIEDNLANLRLVERILARQTRARLLSALSGEAGLRVARQHGPDLILLDLTLPNINGEEVLEELQRDPATRDIPVIILSSDAKPEHIGSALSRGASAYLTKPLNVPEFIAVVEQHLKDSGTDR